MDLFAGAGAGTGPGPGPLRLGLEALSRGASSVDFVENGAAALHSLKANVARLRVKKWTRVFKKDVFHFLEGVQARAAEPPAEYVPAYDLALADPPYTSGAGERLATLWLQRPFSRILCIEHAPHRVLPGKGKRLILGESAVTTYRMRKGKTS